VSLAIGAHAALSIRAAGCCQGGCDRAGDGIRPQGLARRADHRQRPLSDANEPLTQPINDARALTGALRRDGFDVDVVEDASKDEHEPRDRSPEVENQVGLRVMLFSAATACRSGARAT